MFFFQHHGLSSKDFFSVEKLTNPSFPTHIHRAFEVLYVHSGMLHLQVEQQHYEVAAGGLAFVFCNQVHSISSPQGAETTLVMFSPELVGAFYTTHKNCVPKCNLLYPDAPLDLDDLGTVYARKAFLYQICDLLVRSTSMVTPDGLPQAFLLQQIFAYVEQHHGEDCTLQTIAKALQYDYTYLSKFFAKKVGIRFTEYLNGYRIGLACYLMQSGNQHISDVAARCGYSTLRSFHRNFQSHMQCSPRQYIATNVQ